MRSSVAYLSFGTLVALCSASPTAPPKQTVSAELFDKFVRYTKFAAASIPHSCPKPFAGTVIKDINHKSTSTQARIFRADDQQEIILAFPGSSKGDKMTNRNSNRVPFKSVGVSCNDCMVHHGYLKAWNSVSHEILSALQMAHKSHPGYNIIITGHSLGGALATISYASLKGTALPITAGYSQGSPRVGNKAFADYVDKLSGASATAAGNFHRLTHAADPIPDVFRQKAGFRHPRTEYWEMGKQVQSADTTYQCKGQEDPSCSAGVHPKDHKDHGLYSNVSFHDDSTHALCNS